MGRMSYYKMWVVDLANQGKKPGLSNKKTAGALVLPLFNFCTAQANPKPNT